MPDEYEMPKYLINLLLVCLLAFPAWAQEEDVAGETVDTGSGETVSQEPTADTDDAGEIADADDGLEDDSDLDEQTYEEDDDDFVPTEEIPADEPIPFPSNI